MKKMMLPVLVFLCSSFFQSGITEEVQSSLRTGNADKLSAWFDNNVTVTLPGTSDLYGKNAAASLLRDFFNSSGVKGFEAVHKGDNNNAQFIIGRVQTKKGPLRVTVFIKPKGDKQVVQEIKFE